MSSREVEEPHDVVIGGVGQRVGGGAGRLVRPGAARGAVADRLKKTFISLKARPNFIGPRAENEFQSGQNIAP